MAPLHEFTLVRFVELMIPRSRSRDRLLSLYIVLKKTSKQKTKHFLVSNSTQVKKYKW